VTAESLTSAATFVDFIGIAELFYSGFRDLFLLASYTHDNLKIRASNSTCDESVDGKCGFRDRLATVAHVYLDDSLPEKLAEREAGKACGEPFIQLSAFLHRMARHIDVESAKRCRNGDVIQQRSSLAILVVFGAFNQHFRGLLDSNQLGDGDGRRCGLFEQAGARHSKTTPEGSETTACVGGTEQ
jgi:hypothetical protein